MRITKVLYTSKTLADGTHPVMIRISDKGQKKYISTKQSCRASHWSKTLELIGAKDSDRDAKNKAITTLYLQLQNRLVEIEKQGIRPSIELLISREPIENTDKEKSNLIKVFDLKADSCKAPRTQNEYKTFKKVLKTLYGENININEIDQVWANALREKIDDYYGEKNAQKNHFIKCFLGVYSYAEEIGSIKLRKSIKIKSFQHEKKDNYLTTEEVSVIISAYKKDIVAQGRLLPEKQKFALSLFILQMALQGIANIDLAGIKVSDIQIKNIKKISVDWERYNNSVKYRNEIDQTQQERKVIIITFYRRKTRKSVKVVTDYISIKPVLDNLLCGKEPNDYLIPCFSNALRDEKKQIERCARFFNANKKVLNNYLNHFCEIYGYPKIENLTYYQARSAFANQVANMDISYNLIQKMLGQKQTVLEKHYLMPPTEWEQSEVTFRIFNKSKTIQELLSQAHQ